MHIYKHVQSHVVIVHQHALVTSANIKSVSYKIIVFLLQDTVLMMEYVTFFNARQGNTVRIRSYWRKGKTI